MNKYTVIHTIRFSKQQAESLQKLKDYDVNISQFIRLAIAEKIKRDWKQIKEKKERVKLPFWKLKQDEKRVIKNQTYFELWIGKNTQLFSL